MIDVRTLAEWKFVGVPNLLPIGKALQMIEWTKGDGAPNGDFMQQVQTVLPNHDAPILFSAFACVLPCCAGNLGHKGIAIIWNLRRT